MTSGRKLYNINAGYKASLKAKVGGHIVIYDRREFPIDADYRWIVMHEPSSLHVSVSSLPLARDLMKSAARATTPDESDADILPREGDALLGREAPNA